MMGFEHALAAVCGHRLRRPAPAPAPRSKPAHEIHQALPRSKQDAPNDPLQLVVLIRILLLCSQSVVFAYIGDRASEISWDAGGRTERANAKGSPPPSKCRHQQK